MKAIVAGLVNLGLPNFEGLAVFSEVAENYRGRFDAALRIASMEDSSLVARQIIRMRHYICPAPAYIALHGRPQHPSYLGSHQCATYLHRARREEW